MTVEEFRKMLYKYHDETEVEIINQKTRSITKFEVCEVSECFEDDTVRIYLKKS